MAKLAKRMKAYRDVIDREKEYDFAEAVKTLLDCQSAKFDESVEVSLNLNLDPRHADQMLRSTIVLPHGTGKTQRIAVFAKDDKAKEAEKAGADIVGADDLVAKVKGGFLDFDVVVASPDCMPLVGQLGKILGPKGLMPNPKLGTVTPNVVKAIEDIKAGMVEFRTEKNGIVHALVGKKSFGQEKLEENIKAFVSKVKNEKPSGAKGQYMLKMSITSTMGPGIKVGLGTVGV
ncbi:MAG: 50S ribosomal protein L1 [Magnetococcales bacterium]|nr:50S ribosomal protein L1 [Magnetococcales bacterium]PPR18690.1 MAG: 50S ribosomal protein L1 [Pseudomonadota bacterium]|tara:strand:+ start:262 stop:957 length:696 start_codon:yes stop_codon:yes gene_type:complete